MQAPALKRGWMKKQGRKGMIKNWKKRYFVLNGGRISYYETSIDEFPYGDSLKGELHLANTEIIQENKKYNEKQIFVVSFSGEYNLLMEADSSDEADEWIHSIQEHTRYANSHASETAGQRDRESTKLKAQSMRVSSTSDVGGQEDSFSSTTSTSTSAAMLPQASPTQTAQTAHINSLPTVNEDVVEPAAAASVGAGNQSKKAAIAAQIEAEKIDFAIFIEKAPLWGQDFVAKVMGNDTRTALVTDILSGTQIMVTNVIKNTGEGEFGTRGEGYLGAIFVLSCSIIIGLHSLLEILIRFLIRISASLYIFVGFLLIVCGMFELKANVSLFHAPVERNKLVTSGVFRMVRHPIYGGLLLICIGLSITSQRWDKMVLSVILGIVLDKVADLEEYALLQEHPLAYRAVIGSRKKFVPFVC